MDVLAARDTVSAGDDVLLRLAARGDTAAFDALIAGRIARCYRIAWSSLTRGRSADASQERSIPRGELPRLRNPAAFDGWLNRIVANTSLMAHRRRKRRREVQVLPAPAAGDA